MPFYSFFFFLSYEYFVLGFESKFFSNKGNSDGCCGWKSIIFVFSFFFFEMKNLSLLVSRLFTWSLKLKCEF